MRKHSIIFALLLMGATAVVAQILLIRELMITFSGNELSIGIFLANWLILEAIGSFFSGRLVRNTRSSLHIFTILQGLLVILLPLVIYLARISKSYLNMAPGEGSDIITMFYVSLILLTPVALIGGAQFSLGPGLIEELKKTGALSIGKTYLFESLGSILGGFFATYFCLQYLDSIHSSFIIALLNILSAGLLLTYHDKFDSPTECRIFRLIKLFHIILFILSLFIIFSGGLDKLHIQSLEKQWPEYKIVAYQNSVYGNVSLLERDEQLDLLSNGIPILSVPTPDQAKIEDLVHFPLLFHTNPKTIFLIGGGMGGVLNELCKYPLTKIDYTELDPMLIRVMEQFAPENISSVLNHERVNIHYTDGRHFLINTEQKYDVIIINVPDPSTLELNRFYTKEFFQECSSHLEKGGLILFQLPGSASYMNHHLARLHRCLLNTVSEVFSQRIILPFEYVIILATNDKNVPEISPDSLFFRLNQRQIETEIISAAYIRYKLDQSRLNWYQNELIQIESTSINRDLKPSALFYDLLYWNSLFSERSAEFYLQIQNVSSVAISLAIIAFFLIIYLYQRFGNRVINLYLFSSIFTSGFAGMGLSVIFIISFQAFYGYVYFWIGLIISSFMGGLAIGSWLSFRHLSQGKNIFYSFLKSEIGFVIYFVILLVFFHNIEHFDQSDLFLVFFQFFIVLFTLVCGLLVGFQFPLAGEIQLTGNESITKTAGVLYATDLCGAWVGGIVVTLVLIPIIGIIETCFLILLLKCGSMLVYRFSGRSG